MVFAYMIKRKNFKINRLTLFRVASSYFTHLYSIMRSADWIPSTVHATLIIKPHQYDSGLVNSLVRSIMDKVRT